MSEILEVTLHGVNFRLKVPQESERATRFKALFEERADYEAVMAGVLKRLLVREPPPVFGDVGSFIGYYTCYAASLLRDRAPVFALESNPHYAAVTAESVRLNDLERVDVLNYALTETPGQVAMDGPKLISGEPEGSVPALPLDDLFPLQEACPNVLKVDVHGSEGKVLSGAKRLLREAVTHVLLELHPNVYLNRYSPGVSRIQILDLLEECGFSNYYVAGHRYSWSDGLHSFLESGRFAYRPLNRETRDLLLFDRSNHLFVLASKEDPVRFLGEPVTDPSVREYPDWVTT